MLRKIACATALLGMSGIASAQSSVTIYGLMDVAVEHLTNVGPNKSGLTRMPSLGGSLPSRLGFRGTEDLGGGLKAGFTLEMGIAPDSGAFNQGGRGFGRQSFVSLSGPWGSVGLGRQYTMLFWSMLDSDVMGPSLHGVGNLDNYIPNTRADNAISYRGSFSGFTLGATYSFGRDTVNAGPSPSGANCPGESATDSKACREWSAMLKYDTPNWGGALAVDELRGGPGAFAGLNSSAMTDRRTLLNGYFKVDALKIGGGYLRRDNDANVASPRSDILYLGASYPVSPQLVLDAQYSQLKFKSNDDKAQHLALRAMYHLSKRTAVYASAGYLKNSGKSALTVSASQPGSSPLAGVSQTGVGIGVRHSF